MSAPGALVIGGDYRGLGIVRSLGRRGVRVVVAQDDHWLAGRSRFARGRLAWPSEESERLRLLATLARERGFEGWTIFPTADDTAALIARHHAELSRHFRLTTPPWDTFRWTFDKRLTYELADAVSVDHPRSSVPLAREDVRDLDCAFPAVVKPAFRTERDPFSSAKAWAAADRDELIARFDEACAIYEPGRVLIQELIPGGGLDQFSYAAMCVDGEARASLVARRTRQWPTDFGHSSSYVETIDFPEIDAPARRILRTLRFDGLVELEFKRDTRDGGLKLLDVNARAWGWHSIGRAAGVDFPYLAWSAAHGATVPRLRGRRGVRWVHAITDVPAALTDIRAGRLSPRTYVSGLIGRTELAILSLDDPLPALLELPMVLTLLWQRRRGRVDAPVRDRAVA
jgi:predicted ATP-grasp superfamily ATP-dependent carboligase